MSINSLANAAVARRPDTVPIAAVPSGLTEIAMAAATPTPDIAKLPSAGDTTLNVLFGYIPVEILTLYVTTLAAVHQPDKVTWAQLITFIIFFVATPIVVCLTYRAKVMALKKPVSLNFKTWPKWEMIAATFAYCAWAIALPDNPLVVFEWYSSALSGVVVLIASTALGLLAPFFQKPLSIS